MILFIKFLWFSNTFGFHGGLRQPNVAAGSTVLALKNVYFWVDQSWQIRGIMDTNLLRMFYHVYSYRWYIIPQPDLPDREGRFEEWSENPKNQEDESSCRRSDTPWAERWEFAGSQIPRTTGGFPKHHAFIIVLKNVCKYFSYMMIISIKLLHYGDLWISGIPPPPNIYMYIYEKNEHEGSILDKWETYRQHILEI
jgi:hypothetical protein